MTYLIQTIFMHFILGPKKLDLMAKFATMMQQSVLIRDSADMSFSSCMTTHGLTKSQDVTCKTFYAIFVTDCGSCERASYDTKNKSHYVFKFDCHNPLLEVLNCRATGRPSLTLANIKSFNLRRQLINRSCRDIVAPREAKLSSMSQILSCREWEESWRWDIYERTPKCNCPRSQFRSLRIEWHAWCDSNAWNCTLF